MDLKQCIENLKYDINNSGVEDDTFPMICYITMAHRAHRILRAGKASQEDMNQAREFLSLCKYSQSDSLKLIAESS